MTELVPGHLYRLTGDKEGGHQNSYALINDRRQILLVDAVLPEAIPAISAIKRLDNLGTPSDRFKAFRSSRGSGRHLRHGWRIAPSLHQNLSISVSL